MESVHTMKNIAKSRIMATVLMSAVFIAGALLNSRIADCADCDSRDTVPAQIQRANEEENADGLKSLNGMRALLKELPMPDNKEMQSREDACLEGVAASRTPFIGVERFSGGAPAFNPTLFDCGAATAVFRNSAATVLAVSQGCEKFDSPICSRVAKGVANTEIATQRPALASCEKLLQIGQGEPVFMRIYTAWTDFNPGLAGLLLVVVTAIVFSLILCRRNALERLVQENISALRSSEEYLSATLRSIGDGVIACDDEGLVISLNRAAETFTGWKSEEAVGRSINEVFRIINVKTRDRVDNPVFHSISEGINVDLANHTALIARDGREYQIADSCAPIRDESGTVVGAVLVFRDVTGEYLRREEMRLDLEFRSLVAEASARFLRASDEVSFDEAVDQTLASLGRLFGVDRSYLFRFSKDLTIMSNTHEWCASGITAQKDRIQQFSSDELPWWKARILKLNPIQVREVDALPAEASAEKEEWSAQGIKSLICLPICDNRKELIGFMGFDAVRTSCSWPENQILLLKVLAEIIGSAIVRAEAVNQAAKANERHELFFSQSLSGFFFMMLDEPIAWDDDADKEALLDYVMANQRMTKVNQAMLDQYGAKEEDFIGLTPGDLFAHDQEHGRYIWKGLFDNGRWHVETREQRLDGTPIIIDGDYICLYDERGRITGHFGIQTDITERKAYEAEIKSARDRYQSLVSNIPGIVYRCKLDKEWTMLYMSDAVDPLSGYPASDFEGNAVRTYESVIHRDDTDYVAQSINTAVSEGRTWDIEYRVTRKDGDIRWVHEKGRGVQGEDGSVAYLDGFILDITKRKHAEDELRRSEERYRHVSENSPAGLFQFKLTTKGEGSFIYASKGFERILGISENAALKDWLQVHKRINSAYQDSFEKGMEISANRLTQFNETLLFSKDSGEDIWLEVKSDPKRLQDGTTIWTGMFIDIDRQKRAEENLQKEKERLHNIIEGTKAGTWECNLETGETIINENWALILGYRLEDLTPTTMDVWLSNIHPEDKAAAQEILGKHIEGELEFYEHEARMRHKEGHYIWVLGKGKVISRTIEGKPEWMFGTHIDITERKMAEEKIAESEEKIRQIISGTPAVVFSYIIDNEGAVNIAFVSDRVKDTLGYDPEDFFGQNDFWASCVHPDDLGNVMSKVVELRKKQAVEVEYRFRDSEGEWHWLLDRQSVIRRDEEGIEVIGAWTDITDRKRTEESLQLYRRMLSQAQTFARAGTWEFDMESSNLYWSPECEALFGLEEGSFDGTFETFLEYVHPEDRDYVIKTNEPITGLREGVPLEYDHRILTKTGNVRWVRESAGVIRDQDNNPVQITGFVIDITDRKQAENELMQVNEALEEQTAFAREMAARAESASIAKSEFLANMSHEIRTPMNGVIGMTGLLLETALTEEQRRYAEIVRTSADALLGLINDILDFSKIEASKLELETLDFDLEIMLEDFAAALALRAHDKGLELLCLTDPDVPILLRGDPSRLRQVLNNLTGNALKFTTEGEVIIRVKVESQDQLTALLRFSVCDTGIGIPADKLETLFDKFTQADASTTRRYGGTGLGLAISKQLSEMLGGEIGVASKPGKGSEFWFTAHFEKQPDALRVETTLPVDLLDVRVLIVDDNEISREILMNRFNAWGMRPSQVEDGSSALEFLNRAEEESDPFRLAVIDMQMPGMDGEQLGRAIRADMRLNSTRLIMLTSMGAGSDAKRFTDLGFSGYLTKPVRHGELREALSLAMMEKEGTTASSGFVATGHSAREALYEFGDRKVRILLAEDNIINQQVTLSILKKMGLAADAVANGREAVRALKMRPYDLVLMDVQMPELDGFDATRQIRNPQFKVPNPDIPVIAMTAHAMREDREKCLEAGMNDYLSKPVLPKDLAAMLAKWLYEDHDEKEEKSESEDVAKTDDNCSLAAPDWNKEDMMNRLMGDEDLAEMILREFLEDMPRQIEALEASLKCEDASSAERQAHNIKGEVANVGGEVLCGIASETEKACRIGNLNSAGKYIEDMVKAFKLLREAIEKFLDSD